MDRRVIPLTGRLPARSPPCSGSSAATPPATCSAAGLAESLRGVVPPAGVGTNRQADARGVLCDAAAGGDALRMLERAKRRRGYL
jgi:hypothetical protein